MIFMELSSVNVNYRAAQEGNGDQFSIVAPAWTMQPTVFLGIILQRIPMVKCNLRSMILCE